MTKLWPDGLPLSVLTDRTGLPSALRWRGEWEPVTVANRWRIADEWWRVPIHRDYFRIETRSLLAEIFRDRVGKAWYLERIYD